MNYEQQVVSWITQDDWRMDTLHIASELGFSDWCLAAGFVRNLIWDRLQGKTTPTPLNDIDFIYYAESDVTADTDLHFEQQLKAQRDRPWSVKNQARMHVRNGDAPYTSCEDAMRYWVEIETAVGVKLSAQNELKIIAPFGLEANFSNTITRNPNKRASEHFDARLRKKNWQSLWPDLVARS